MNHVVLFDMDGTLTEARKSMSLLICRKLILLQSLGVRIGIVSGSDFDYIIEQCGILTDINEFDYTNIDFYPCNGTKHYKLTRSFQKTVVYENFMDKAIGKTLFNKVIYNLARIQSELQHESWSSDLPLTGNFIQYRGSMINYCPIGRNANTSQRKSWLELDKKHRIRKNIFAKYFASKCFDGLTVKFGGETSFDIYPDGWDKTFVLKNFGETDKIWFVGDKCEGTGNDKEIYDIISKQGRGFKTSSPAKTAKIIDSQIIKTIKG